MCGPEGLGAAVLLRAVVITSGTALARRRRGPVPDRNLADGPGKLAQALGIDRALDGRRMIGSPVEVFPGPRLEATVTARIGISKAVDWPLRFLVAKESGATTSVAPPVVPLRSVSTRRP